jgi:hypothetical protein
MHELQAHLETKAGISLHGLADSDLANARYEVEVRTHNEILNLSIAQSASSSKFFLSEVR